jgi:hypothetical protein
MRGRPFQPGNQHGRGRPPGSKNKVAGAAQEAAQAVLDSHAEALLKKGVLLALQGNAPLLRLFAQLLAPSRRERVLKFRLPVIKTMANLVVASETVMRGVTRGHLTLSEAQAFLAMIDDRRHLMESQDLDSRIGALETGSKEEGEKKDQANQETERKD